LGKHRPVGLALPIIVDDAQGDKTYDAFPVTRTSEEVVKGFNEYIRGKLAHLNDRERYILEPVLQRYRHLFHGLESHELGCTYQVEHTIEKGDARPIKRNPYKTSHALKPVVENHINEMLERNIIEPSMSPWSSSIVLVQKQSKTEASNRDFFVDYRSLNAVTKPDAYPISNITDTLDSLGQNKIFTVLDMESGYH
jgi:hypothetical protein